MVLRHPCAVANSKMQANWDNSLTHFLIQEELKKDFLAPYLKEINAAQSEFDKHIFWWCIENYVPLKQFNESEILIIFYEELYKNPQHEINNILSFIGEEFTSKFINNVYQPSAVSTKDSAILTGKDVINDWRKNISKNQINRAIEICSFFGLDKIYNESSSPLVVGNEALNIL